MLQDVLALDSGQMFNQTQINSRYIVSASKKFRNQRVDGSNSKTISHKMLRLVGKNHQLKRIIHQQPNGIVMDYRKLRAA